MENDSGYITADALPTKTSELENDSGYITEDSIPTKTSQLENDSEYATSTEVDNAVAVETVNRTDADNALSERVDIIDGDKRGKDDLKVYELEWDLTELKERTGCPSWYYCGLGSDDEGFKNEFTDDVCQNRLSKEAYATRDEALAATECTIDCYTSTYETITVKLHKRLVGGADTLAKHSELPSKTSQLENDSGFAMFPIIDNQMQSDCVDEDGNVLMYKAIP